MNFLVCCIYIQAELLDSEMVSSHPRSQALVGSIPSIMRSVSFLIHWDWV